MLNRGWEEREEEGEGGSKRSKEAACGAKNRGRKWRQRNGRENEICSTTAASASIANKGWHFIQFFSPCGPWHRSLRLNSRPCVLERGWANAARLWLSRHPLCGLDPGVFRLLPPRPLLWRLELPLRGLPLSSTPIWASKRYLRFLWHSRLPLWCQSRMPPQIVWKDLKWIRKSRGEASVFTRGIKHSWRRNESFDDNFETSIEDSPRPTCWSPADT